MNNEFYRKGNLKKDDVSRKLKKFQMWIETVGESHSDRVEKNESLSARNHRQFGVNNCGTKIISSKNRVSSKFLKKSKELKNKKLKKFQMKLKNYMDKHED